jgi:hypothetical protein
VPIDAAANANEERGQGGTISIAGIQDATTTRPFAWQVGRRLWILDGGRTDWVLAELLFEPQTCRYREVRRSRYRWPREAAGALLGRTYFGGERRVEAAARGLSDWISQLES